MIHKTRIFANFWNNFDKPPIGGSDIGSFESAMIMEEFGYGCCGITTPMDVNNLGVSSVPFT